MMRFLDELKKIVRPYEDEDDFFEGANEQFKTQAPVAAAPVSQEQALFESSFADDNGSSNYTKAPPPPRKAAPKAPAKAAPAAGDSEGSIFGNLSGKKPTRRERTVNFGGKEAQVILFSPKTFDEAGEVVNHILQNHSVVMTLEGLPSDTARRLLDFISGIAFALQGKITPVSAKTYFITPQNVDIVGAQTEAPVSDGQYF